MAETILFEMRCSQCHWVEIWGLERAMRELVRMGRYRIVADFNPEIIRELFLIYAVRMDCPNCGVTGLITRIAPKESWTWTDEVCCEHCGKIIPTERLAAVPNTTLCVNCQSAIEHGERQGDAEYCPRCGAVMVLKSLAVNNGITRPTLVCPGCRYREQQTQDHATTK
jgi:ssDNA-binding Zn-finger/Zn-ribbon topoisomerase 1